MRDAPMMSISLAITTGPLWRALGVGPIQLRLGQVHG
jgi:hypothetical protein